MSVVTLPNPEPFWETGFRTDADDGAGDGSSEQEVTRCDRLPFELLRPQPGPGGSLLVDGIAAKPGVYTYRRADGSTFRELVTAETLARPEDLESLARATLTLNHPPRDIDPENVARYSVGDLGDEVEVRKGGFVRIKMAIRRRDALDAVQKGGVRELSGGYRARVRLAGGEHPEFGRYDQEQVGRFYNHLALVPKGRHGSEAAARIDADGVMDPPDPIEEPTAMNKELLKLLASLGGDPTRFDSDDAVIAEIGRLASQQRSDMEMTSGELAALQAKMSGLEEALKGATGEKEDMAAKMEDMSNELAGLTEKLEAVTGERDALKADADARAAKEQAKADAAERKVLQALPESLGLKLDADAKAKLDADATPLSEVRLLLVRADVARTDGVELPADPSDGYVAGWLGGMQARAKVTDKDGKRRADGWDDLSGDRKAKPPAQGNNNRGDDDSKPTAALKTYRKAADSAFEAAGKGSN